MTEKSVNTLGEDKKDTPESSKETLKGVFEKAGEKEKQKEKISLLSKEVDVLFRHENFKKYLLGKGNAQRIGKYKKELKREIKKNVEAGKGDVNVKKTALAYVKSKGAKAVVKIIEGMIEDRTSNGLENKNEKLREEIVQYEKTLSGAFHELSEKFKDFLEVHKEEVEFNKKLRKLVFDDLQHDKSGGNIVSKGEVSSEYLKKLKTVLSEAKKLKELDWEKELEIFKKGGAGVNLSPKARGVKGDNEPIKDAESEVGKETTEKIPSEELIGTNKTNEKKKNLKKKITALVEKISDLERDLALENENKAFGTAKINHIKNLEKWKSEAESQKIILEKELEVLESSSLKARFKNAGANQEVLTEIMAKSEEERKRILGLEGEDLAMEVKKIKKEIKSFKKEKRKHDDSVKSIESQRKEDDPNEKGSINDQEEISENEADPNVLGDPAIDNEGSEGSIDAEFKIIETPEAQLKRLQKESPGIYADILKKGLNEETGKSFYDEASVENKILMILEENSNRARRDYVEKDYEMDKKLGSIKRFFGRAVGTNNYEEEILDYKKTYEDAREEYKNAMLQFGGVEDYDFEGKEEKDFVLGLVAREFQVNEQLRWRSDKIDVAMENSPVYEKFKEYSLGMVNRYREMRKWPSDKINQLFGLQGISKGMGIVGGILIVGKGLSEAGVAVNPAFRIFSATVATVGYKQMLESFAERSRLKKSEKEVGGAIKEFEKSYEDFDSWLSEKNKNLHENIQDEKLWRNYRTLAAGGAAMVTILGGSWAGEKVVGYFGGNTDPESAVKSESVTSSGNEIKAPEKNMPVQSEAPHGSGLHNGQAISEVSSEVPAPEEVLTVGEKAVEAATIKVLPENGKINLNIEKGSSVEKTLKEFLIEHKNEFKEGKMGWSEDKFVNADEWAGRRAHVIAQEFAGDNPGINIDLVQPDTDLKIDFSNPADIEISGLEDLGQAGAAPDSMKSVPGAESIAVGESAVAVGFTQRLEIDPDHYAEIKNMSVEDFVNELKRTGNLKYGGEAMDINLPDGKFAGSGYVENRRLGVILGYLADNGKIENVNQSIESTLGQVKEADFMNGVAHYEGEFGDIPGVENIPDDGVAQGATEEGALRGESNVENLQSVDEASSQIENENNIIPQEAASQEISSAEKNLTEKIRQEMMIAKSFGFSSNEYSAIDDVSIGKLIQEIPEKDSEIWKQYKSANSYSPDLPSDGSRGWSEFKKQESLANFFRAYNKSNLPEVDGSMTIGDFFRQVDANSLAENDTFKLDTSSLDFGSDEEYENYLQKFTETEILEVRKIIVNENLNVWKEIRLKTAESVDNETFKNAYSKVNEIINLRIIKGESVEKWTARMAKAVYEQGKAPEVKEILKTVINKTT